MAQEAPPVEVSFEPLREGWNWQSWAAELTANFESALTRRYREGLPRREFVAETTPARLTFLVRIDQEGRIRRFVPLSAGHRYLSYLVERTAREIAPGLLHPPYGLPYPTLEGRISFTLRFKATGFYKRHYFEEPIDSLDLPPFEPIIKVKDSQPLFLYEPPGMDKNKLLDDYRRRIGLNPGIQDTSIYTPLDLHGMYLALTLPFDSLNVGSPDTLRLRRDIEQALEKAGAHVLDELPVEDYSSPPAPETAAADSDSLSSAPDSMSAVSSDSSSASAPVSPAPAAPAASQTFSPMDSALQAADLPKVFAKVVNLRRAFVLSAGLARDSLPGRALCRVRLYELRRPDDFKRRLDYRFASSGSLPDTLGRVLVGLLVTPPPKPEPPKPKAPPAAKAAASADSTAKAATDSSAAGKDTTGAAKPAPQAAPDSSAARADTSAPKAAPAQAPADSTSLTAPRPAAAQPAGGAQAAPPDSTVKAPAVDPAAAPDTAKTGTAAPQQATPSTAPEQPAQPAAPADSTKPKQQ